MRGPLPDLLDAGWRATYVPYLPVRHVTDENGHDDGAGRVGKTSILLRYVKGEYNDKQQSTIQVSRWGKVG